MLLAVYRYETPLKLLMNGYLKTGEVLFGDEDELVGESKLFFSWG